MRILITNSVPLNGGDEALLRATVEALSARFERCEITVLCKQLELSRKYLPDLDFATDLEFAQSEEEWQASLNLYREADVVISAPGGFIHDFYEIEDRLAGFEVAIGLGKPVFIFGQSVGPFWKPNSCARVRRVFNQLTAICVRDRASIGYLKKCGVDESRIHLTGDAAFLWKYSARERLSDRQAGAKKTIGLCFRVWPLNDTHAVKDTIAKAEQLCLHLLEDQNRNLLFVSTCQGIPGYVDDSELAAQIVDRLPAHLKSRCIVDRERHDPKTLMRILGTCDAFIGMRLHACLLSMLAGTPALGLGYEQKTAEIFGQLGLRNYQVHFNEDYAQWLMCFEGFIRDIQTISDSLPDALDRMHSRAQLNLELIATALPELKSLDTFPQKARDYQPEYFGLLTQKAWNTNLELLISDLAKLIPGRQRIILVDDGALRADAFDCYSVIPFLESNGAYWGPPPDDDVAVAELERMRGEGASYIAFAWPAFWWLDHYFGLTSYLESNFRCVLQNDRVRLFDINAAVPVQGHEADILEDGQ